MNNSHPISSHRAPNFQIRISKSTVERVDEYRLFLKNKTGFYPSFSETIRNLVDHALTHLGIDEKENEPESNEKNSE
jgi:hypothetical protein